MTVSLVISHTSLLNAWNYKPKQQTFPGTFSEDNTSLLPVIALDVA